jgi:citrate synthase
MSIQPPHHLASNEAVLYLPDGQSIELPVLTGSEHEHAVDISKLRAKTGHITMDPGYGNTGSCQSEITFLDGEKGPLPWNSNRATG